MAEATAAKINDSIPRRPHACRSLEPMKPPADSTTLVPINHFLLRIASPTQAAAQFPLGTSRMIVGRAGHAAIVLDSPKVSRRHAELVKDPFGRWWVRDMGSRNGTCLNGKRISHAIFEPGDVLEIGGYTLTLAPQASPLEQKESPRHLSVTENAGERIKRLGEHESPRIDASHLSALSEFGHQLNITHDESERLLQLCRLMISSQFRGRHGIVLRVPREQIEEPQVLCGPQAPADWREPLPPISRSVLRAVCESLEPVLATNSATGAEDIQLSMPSAVIAMTVMAAPIRFDDYAVDLLYAVFGPEYNHSDWLALIALAVKQFQQAEAVWQHVARIREYAAVARELELAQEIQLRLIPQRLQINGVELAIGFRACHWVGGDYADVVPLSDGRVLIAIADVCGKGLPAAMITSSIHTMVHANLRAGKSVNEMVVALNAYLSDYVADGNFVTMICIVLDPASGNFDCINAGHPPGLMIDPRGNLRQMNLAANMPLALSPLVGQDEGGILQAGDLLILYTDGLIEAVNEDGDMLGVQGLGEELCRIAAAQAGAPVAKLVNDVTGFLDLYEHGRIAADDRTFIIVRLSDTVTGTSGPARLRVRRHRITRMLDEAKPRTDLPMANAGRRGFSA